MVRGVNRVRSAHKALKATGRELYVNDNVLSAMPKGNGSKAELVFFRVGKHIIYDHDLDAEYSARGLVPADPFALAAHNEADPVFGDVRSNATVWRDAEGQQCHISFYGSSPVPYFGGRQKCHTLHVGAGCEEWGPDWWFAGVRKSA
ncbi:hypothetical protein KKD81_02665 [Patescibacteria group bacterium]|nr:hypothetical protein [Patescibacteria group bacterium]